MILVSISYIIFLFILAFSSTEINMYFSIPMLFKAIYPFLLLYRLVFWPQCETLYSPLFCVTSLDSGCYHPILSKPPDSMWIHVWVLVKNRQILSATYSIWVLNPIYAPIYRMSKPDPATVYQFEINVSLSQKFHIFEDKRVHWFKNNGSEFLRSKDY